MNWEAITSISTVFLTLFTLGLMLATIWLAIIALQAKNTWKEELQEKKKLDLLRDIKTLLNSLHSYLCTIPLYINREIFSYDKVKDSLIELHRLLEQLLNLQDELSCINYDIFEGILLAIITKGNNCPLFKKAAGEVVQMEVPISDEEAQNQEITGLLNNREELMELIRKSINICNEEIKKFYTK